MVFSENSSPSAKCPKTSCLTGRTPYLVHVRERIERLAPQRLPVLIQGETGTGKEVAARALFDACPRGQFVPIDCGSLVGSLMESELFGHVRGAFTGAGESRKGLMDAANGGTAFFDEIGDLPLEMQVKLLRLLQEKEFRPVGSLQRTRIDVRIVAATHRDLSRDVANGRFREDLYYRLNVVNITLPPLRERKDDIPILIEQFLEASDRRYVIVDEAMHAMQKYDWPGNIRELKNCVDRMVALSNGLLLHLHDLPEHVIESSRYALGRTVAAEASAQPDRRPFGQTASAGILPLCEVERRAITHALGQTRGDRTFTAQLLGIGRTTLYRKLKAYGIHALDSNAA